MGSVTVWIGVLQRTLQDMSPSYAKGSVPSVITGRCWEPHGVGGLSVTGRVPVEGMLGAQPIALLLLHPGHDVCVAVCYGL
jgi:hypothetical protein